VEYETAQRLHVHIYDTPLQQYQVGEAILPRPARETLDPGSSELAFDYIASPFAFWVTRKVDGHILFDTRRESIPTYTDMVEIEGRQSPYTILPAHPLVFEDQYLQISSALPNGANIYGLGEVLVSHRSYGMRHDANVRLG
jgi:alpha-glucosidase